ncbi:MAG TPA: NAD-dependent succinate-semialdehyde dehydrogenase [Caulobacteraceae bacterium]
MNPPNPLALARADLLRRQAYVNGRWIDAPLAATFAVTNPADGSLIVELADCGAETARAATDAAVAAFEGWRRETGKARAALLRKWFDLIVANGEDLARLMSWEMGKPLAESRAEVAYGAGFIEWFAEEAKRGGGDVIPAPVPGREIVVVKEPVGVVAAITPWNFPVAMLTRKLGPALAAGCAAVVKPAGETPLCALALAVLAEEAGLPPGLINIVTCGHDNTEAVGKAWLDDVRVRKLSFTGSTPVGRALAEASAKTLKRVSLELGGNAPFVVFDDADLDVALASLKAAKFRNTGQACTAANRILVDAAVADAFVGRVVSMVQNLSVGAAAEGPADIGPLINEKAVAKVERLVADAVAKGATVLVGGARHPRGPAFWAPTVLDGITPEMDIWNEEVFGPVISITRFRGETEGVRLANATDYGLASYVFSRDVSRCWRVARALDVGMSGINEGLISTEAAPFGGVKQSGYGREGSAEGLAEYQALKYLCFGGLNG